jgi:putative flippase GtrA
VFNDALSGDLGNRPVAAIESVASTHRLESVRSRLIVLFHETWKYLLVSVAALAVDYALLAGLTRVAGVEWQIAAAASFTAGLFVNYALSVTLVFKERRVKSRGLEFLGFFIIGALGLGLNELVMKYFVELIHLDPLLAKIPATGVGFVFNFVARRALLFTAPRPA